MFVLCQRAAALFSFFIAVCAGVAFAQNVQITTPPAPNPTVVTNATGETLRIHVFYGWDEPQIIAFHEADLPSGGTIDLDSIAGVEGPKRGGEYALNVWLKGWGLLPFDQHWKKDVRVRGTSTLRGAKKNLTATNSDPALATIRIRNTTDEDVTAYIYKGDDTWRAVAAQKFVVRAGSAVDQTRPGWLDYGLELVNGDGDMLYTGVVNATFGVNIADATPQPLSVASFNVKLMPFPFEAHASYAEGGYRSSYDERLNTMASMSSALAWGGEGMTEAGFDVMAYQEVWRGTAIGDAHYVRLRDKLKANGFLHDNIIRGTGRGTERGWHHGLMLASRYPIASYDEMAFSDADSNTHDAKAEKGALHAKISVKGVMVSVFNTHLQANEEGQPSSKATRSKQLKELRAFISEKSAKSDAVIVMGDFNIPRAGVTTACAGVDAAACRALICGDQQNVDTEYCQWFSDADRNGNWSDFVDYVPTRQATRLDYILLQEGGGATELIRPESLKIFVDGRNLPVASRAGPSGENGFRPITDHAAVYGKFMVGP